jgi:hypothetical protein
MLLIPKFFKTHPETQMEIANIDPADRSMPPSSITHNMPTPINAMIGV